MDHYFVLTGAPGSGKTTVLNALRQLGIATVDEPARQILAEQRSIGGAGVPDRNPALFTELLLSRALYAHRRHSDSEGPLLFDRGLPDVIGYARLFGAPAEAATAAARRYRYNRTAFLAPALPEIYCRDDERTMSFEAARDFGEMIRGGYKTLGYEIVELPRAAPGARAGFMLARMLERLAY
ncbi:MAG TPA: AAA family ATPase [Kiloniellaceae bacterium]